jgi:hypothetical protein
MKTITVYASELLIHKHELEIPDGATYDDAVEAFYNDPDIKAGRFQGTEADSFQIDRIEGV